MHKYGLPLIIKRRQVYDDILYTFVTLSLRCWCIFQPFGSFLCSDSRASFCRRPATSVILTTCFCLIYDAYGPTIVCRVWLIDIGNYVSECDWRQSALKIQPRLFHLAPAAKQLLWKPVIIAQFPQPRRRR